MMMAAVVFNSNHNHSHEFIYAYAYAYNNSTWIPLMCTQKSTELDWSFFLICTYLPLVCSLRLFIHLPCSQSSLCMLCMCECFEVWVSVGVCVWKSTLNIKEKMRYLSFPELNAKHLLFVLMCRANHTYSWMRHFETVFQWKLLVNATWDQA